jgi:hypothetical protein
MRKAFRNSIVSVNGNRSKDEASEILGLHSLSRLTQIANTDKEFSESLCFGVE